MIEDEPIPIPEEETAPPMDEALFSMASSLGFEATPDMLQLRQQMLEAADLEQLRSQMGAYQELGQQVVDAQDETRIQAQLAAIIDTAAVYYQNRLDEPSWDALQDALLMAEQLGLDEIIEQLQTLLNPTE